MRRSFTTCARSRQSGTVLFVALVLLLVLTLIGVTAARMQTVEEQMAQNDDNHQLALQNAESVLRHVETNFGAGMYDDTMFTGGTPGLLTLSTEVTTAVSNFESIADQPAPTFNAQSTPYTGPALSTATTAPQYVVENLPSVTPPAAQMGSAKYNAPSSMAIRTTTLATGGDSSSTVTLQSVAN